MILDAKPLLFPAENTTIPIETVTAVFNPKEKKQNSGFNLWLMKLC